LEHPVRPHEFCRATLFNQHDLIALRTQHGVDQLVPGLTGWAQINGRDELSIADKVGFDAQYLHARSLHLDMQILWKTFTKVYKSEGVTH
jgi:O-antigen biosynthesis protein WbqP